ncbi:MAG: hypothetical protein IH623_21835 [Verrucomicrobia bacterium]|nr:hypothetical protein [Verrucomicrobiota bacterium]
MSGELSITGVGAVTPVGLSAQATCAALRAGVARMGTVASSQVEAEFGGIGPATGGRVPLEWLRGGPEVEEWPGHEHFEIEPPSPAELFIPDGPARLVALAVPAAHEAWSGTGRGVNPPPNWGLFIGLAEAESGKELLRGLVDSFPSWRPSSGEVINCGRASALVALHRAVAEIASNRIAGALVGGVDSLLRPSVYESLTEAGQLRDADDNPEGIYPGEAAAFIALEKRPVSGRIFARLLSTGTAEEPTAGTEQPNRGEGLTAAIRSARAATPHLKDRPLVICDLNGNRYRALEWGLALIRALGDLRWREGKAPSDEFWHPADCMGDIGAASGILNCLWAVESLRKGYAGTSQVLVWGASDTSPRAASIIGTNS